MRKPFLLSGAVVVALALGGCTTLPTAINGVMQNSANRYTQPQAQQAVRVRLGTVIAVRRVDIAATPLQVGTGSGVGAALGALAGRLIGDGKGKTAAQVAGAIGGGIAGNKIAAGAFKQPGLAITIELDDKTAIEVTQAADVQVSAGQRVQVIGSGYGADPVRVIPLQQASFDPLG